jgi:hypothetical protein
MIGDLLSTSTNVTNGKYSVEGTKRGVNNLDIQFALSEKGNPKNYQLSPDKIQELRNIPGLDKNVEKAIEGTYVCTDANACQPMPPEAFNNLKKAVTTGNKALLP